MKRKFYLDTVRGFGYYSYVNDQYSGYTDGSFILESTLNGSDTVEKHFYGLFNLSDLPVGSKINSAILHLNNVYYYHTASPYLGVTAKNTTNEDGIWNDFDGSIEFGEYSFSLYYNENFQIDENGNLDLNLEGFDSILTNGGLSKGRILFDICLQNWPVQGENYMELNEAPEDSIWLEIDFTPPPGMVPTFAGTKDTHLSDGLTKTGETFPPSGDIFKATLGVSNSFNGYEYKLDRSFLKFNTSIFPEGTFATNDAKLCLIAGESKFDDFASLQIDVLEVSSGWNELDSSFWNCGGNVIASVILNEEMLLGKIIEIPIPLDKFNFDGFTYFVLKLNNEATEPTGENYIQFEDFAYLIFNTNLVRIDAEIHEINSGANSSWPVSNFQNAGVDGETFYRKISADKSGNDYYLKRGYLKFGTIPQWAVDGALCVANVDISSLEFSDFALEFLKASDWGTLEPNDWGCGSENLGSLNFPNEQLAFASVKISSDKFTPGQALFIEAKSNHESGNAPTAENSVSLYNGYMVDYYGEYDNLMYCFPYLLVALNYMELPLLENGDIFFTSSSWPPEWGNPSLWLEPYEFYWGVSEYDGTYYLGRGYMRFGRPYKLKDLTSKITGARLDFEVEYDEIPFEIYAGPNGWGEELTVDDWGFGTGLAGVSPALPLSNESYSTLLDASKFSSGEFLDFEIRIRGEASAEPLGYNCFYWNEGKTKLIVFLENPVVCLAKRENGYQWGWGTQWPVTSNWGPAFEYPYYWGGEFDDPDYLEYRSYLRFFIPENPPGLQIKSVKLWARLKYKENQDNLNPLTKVLKANTDWDPLDETDVGCGTTLVGQIEYNNLPNTGVWFYIELDATKLSLGEVNAFEIIADMEAPTNSDYIGIYSASSGEANAPYMAIEYEPPPGINFTPLTLVPLEKGIQQAGSVSLGGDKLSLFSQINSETIVPGEASLGFEPFGLNDYIKGGFLSSGAYMGCPVISNTLFTKGNLLPGGILISGELCSLIAGILESGLLPGAGLVTWSSLGLGKGTATFLWGAGENIIQGSGIFLEEGISETGFSSGNAYQEALPLFALAQIPAEIFAEGGIYLLASATSLEQKIPDFYWLEGGTLIYTPPLGFISIPGALLVVGESQISPNALEINGKTSGGLSAGGETISFSSMDWELGTLKIGLLSGASTIQGIIRSVIEGVRGLILPGSSNTRAESIQIGVETKGSFVPGGIIITPEALPSLGGILSRLSPGGTKMDAPAGSASNYVLAKLKGGAYLLYCGKMGEEGEINIPEFIPGVGHIDFSDLEILINFGEQGLSPGAFIWQIGVIEGLLWVVGRLAGGSAFIGVTPIQEEGTNGVFALNSGGANQIAEALPSLMKTVEQGLAPGGILIWLDPISIMGNYSGKGLSPGISYLSLTPVANQGEVYEANWLSGGSFMETIPLSLQKKVLGELLPGSLQIDVSSIISQLEQLPQGLIPGETEILTEAIIQEMRNAELQWQSGSAIILHIPLDMEAEIPEWLLILSVKIRRIFKDSKIILNRTKNVEVQTGKSKEIKI